ncbi:MAG: glyoxalase [Xanthobacteraceae bacterium]|jgi:predicted enzyme related to lactoylglutathione lyase
MGAIKVVTVGAMLLEIAAGPVMAKDKPAAETPSVAVGPQYSAAHIYVTPEDFDRFGASVVATFGGTRSQPASFKITPTPSETAFQFVLTPVGNFSVFAFKTSIPYPFGVERAGYLVGDFDAAVRSAKAHDADIVVAPFPDPIGRDAIIEWPGGLHMQLYWHTTPPNYAELQTVPENRVYLSVERADAFVRDFVGFSRGKVVSDVAHAPGLEIGRPKDSYRRVRIDSGFGKFTVLATDGHLPYPYGREINGYEVADLPGTLAKAKAAGVTVVVDPYTVDGRQASIVAFPGGYIAEIHSATGE